MYSIHRVTPATYRSLVPRLVDIYLAAMEYNPAIRPARIAAWRLMADEAGFCCMVARSNTSGQPIGLAFGRPGRPHHWWWQQVRQGLDDAVAPRCDRTVLDDYFEIAEVHVAPSWQGHGIGRRLVTNLLDGVDCPRALLSTPEVDREANLAFGLYRSLGFSDVLRNFHFPGDHRAFAVLCRQLPLTASGTR
nr:GNAT family N-acetyltransferase [Corynebacterium mendelii]